MANEAIKRANKEHSRMVLVRLHKTNDIDIITKLENLENESMSSYIKRLIRKDMRKRV